MFASGTGRYFKPAKTVLTGESGYYFQRLPWHLGQAGREPERRALLFDFAWMHAKLKALGVNALIADYDAYLAARQD